MRVPVLKLDERSDATKALYPRAVVEAALPALRLNTCHVINARPTVSELPICPEDSIGRVHSWSLRGDWLVADIAVPPLLERDLRDGATVMRPMFMVKTEGDGERGQLIVTDIVRCEALYPVPRALAGWGMK